MESLTANATRTIFTSMNEYASYGRQVRRRRKALGISQRDLSEIAGDSLHTLSDIESGKANPTIATLDRILRPLGMVLSLEIRGVE